MLSALSINLSNSNGNKKSASDRRATINKFIQDVSNEKTLDFIFTQDKCSIINLKFVLQNLRKLREFDLHFKQYDGNSSAHVGIFINTERFEVTNIEKDTNSELFKLRKEKSDFFTDRNRAILLLVKDRATKQKILLSSFHAKRNKITDSQREIHIIEFLQLLEAVAKKDRNGSHFSWFRSQSEDKSIQESYQKKEFLR